MFVFLVTNMSPVTVHLLSEQVPGGGLLQGNVENSSAAWRDHRSLSASALP
jgi:hypothetical protein